MEFITASLPYPEIDPFIFKIGPIGLRWYALAYIAGILLGWRYLAGLARQPGLWGAASVGPDPRGKKTKPRAPYTVEQIGDFVAWATLGIILGGRLGYVLFYKPDLLWTDPFGVIAIWRGGMSFHGGLLGVGLVTWLFTRRNAIPTLRLMDALACAAPIGLFFGRIANFINGELYGRPTDVPWAMVFPADRLETPRHPSQLYEAALEGLVLFLLIRLASHRFGALARPGATTGIFLAGYGLARASLETVREPDAHMPDFALGLTMGMMLSAPMIIGGGFLLWRAYKGGGAQAGRDAGGATARKALAAESTQNGPRPNAAADAGAAEAGAGDPGAGPDRTKNEE
ncbi:MAG: prolipoprotein diacylglyceryl transferase [Parvularculaceae bacterium]